MTNELKAAAERVGESLRMAEEGVVEKVALDITYGGDMDGFKRDMQTLSDGSLARLAADEQQAKVDAEPIGREWFNENGNDVSSIIVCRDNIEYEIEAACGNPSIGIDLTVNDRYACKIIHIPHVTTRGQLRKLLEALKGGA